MGQMLLSVKDLTVRFTTEDGTVHAVNGVSFDVEAGETLGLVGESGCGKSATGLAIMGLLPGGRGTRVEGRIEFEGGNLLALRDSDVRKKRGRNLAMVFQDPLTSLNPVLTVSRQITEIFLTHRNDTHADARRKSIGLLERVGIPDPDQVMHRYPHQLSGGIRQRVMIAMALALEPQLLIADEPTTALDVTTQAQILELIRTLIRDTGTAVIFVSHDLGLVASMTQRVCVMYAGNIVEVARTSDIFARPTHPYTVGLLNSIPRLDSEIGSVLTPIEGAPPDQLTLAPGCSFAPRCAWRIRDCWKDRPLLENVPGHLNGATAHRVACHNGVEFGEVGVGRPLRTGFTPAPPPPGQPPGRTGETGGMTGPSAAQPLLEVRDLAVEFRSRARGSGKTARGVVRAVDRISFAIEAGETVGLVGESGCGKSTTGRAIVGLNRPTSGSIRLDGHELVGATGEPLRRLRRRMQMIFQDPFSSLNPRMTVEEIIVEPLEIHGVGDRQERRERVLGLLDAVGLSTSAMDRYPHQFSGGQKQRIGIARALALNPDLVIADEPVSSLDVSIQAQIINLLGLLQKTFGLTFLFIAHDLAAVRHISDRVMVMFLGRIVETATTFELFSRPRHPYTVALLSAIPVPDPEFEARRKRILLAGDVPSVMAPPSGCRFHTRCWLREELGRPAECETTDPGLDPVSGTHSAACHFRDALNDMTFHQQTTGTAGATRRSAVEPG